MAGFSKAEKVSIWIQVATFFSVIMGLALVVYELQQANEIAAAERLVMFLDNEIENRVASVGDVALAPIMVKGCLAPEDLTLEEIWTYETMSGVDMNVALRIHATARLTGEWEQSKSAARTCLESYLGSEFARISYRLTEEGYEEDVPEIAALAADILANETWFPCETFTSDLQKAIAEAHANNRG